MTKFKDEGTLSEMGAKAGDVVGYERHEYRLLELSRLGSARAVRVNAPWEGDVIGEHVNIYGHCKYRMISRAPDASQPLEAKPKSKYHRIIRGVMLDVYDLLWAWGVTCPASQHAIKKLMMAGGRGHKDRLTDLQEARDAIDRAIEHEKENANA